MTLNRLCLILLASSGAVWLFSVLLGWQQKREAEAYYVQHVQPGLEAQKRASAAYDDAWATRKRGEKVSLPKLELQDTTPLTKLLDRREEQLSTRALRYYSGTAFVNVRTPWYGWLILLLALAGMTGVFLWLVTN